METLITEDPAAVASRVARLVAAFPVASVDLDDLALFASELAERVAALASLPAEPGDSAVTYLEHRAEALELVDAIASGLQLMTVPA